MAKRQQISNDNYLSGIKEIADNIQDAIDRLKYQSSKGLADALLFIGKESQNRAPVDTGDLRGSLYVEINGVKIAQGNKGGGITETGTIPDNAVTGCVGYAAEYAADQHEHTEYEHKNGQAKYLESVLVENQGRILHLIAGGIMGE